jgi:hypothetical protein
MNGNGLPGSEISLLVPADLVGELRQALVDDLLATGPVVRDLVTEPDSRQLTVELRCSDCGLTSCDRRATESSGEGLVRKIVVRKIVAMSEIFDNRTVAIIRLTTVVEVY